LIIIEDPVRKIGCALLERIERPLGWDISVVGATKINFSFQNQNFGTIRSGYIQQKSEIVLP
jgi:hypothetical protein